jgi:hypothetical protein
MKWFVFAINVPPKFWGDTLLPPGVAQSKASKILPVG